MAAMEVIGDFVFDNDTFFISLSICNVHTGLLAMWLNNATALP